MSPAEWSEKFKECIENKEDISHLIDRIMQDDFEYFQEVSELCHPLKRHRNHSEDFLQQISNYKFSLDVLEGVRINLIHHRHEEALCILNHILIGRSETHPWRFDFANELEDEGDDE
jgi:hypothetical protein